MFRKAVKVKMGKRVVDFGDGNRLKSDLVLTTNLPIPTIKEIVDKVRESLSKREQPVFPRDIAATTHVVLVEMGLKNEGKEYMKFITDRHENRKLLPKKIQYIKCDHCGMANDTKHDSCIVCGRILDKSKIERTIV